MSTTKLLYHIVIGTYSRRRTIPIASERLLYAFINNFSKKKGVKIYRIGGMPDHIHILCSIPPQLSLSDYVKSIKAESSKFLKFHPNFDTWERWGEGYFAVTIGRNDYMPIYNYISNQKPHHTKKSFAEEYREFLIQEGFDNEL